MRLNVSSSGRSQISFGPIGGLLWLALLCAVFLAFADLFLDAVFTAGFIGLVLIPVTIVWAVSYGWLLGRREQRARERSRSETEGYYARLHDAP